MLTKRKPRFINPGPSLQPVATHVSQYDMGYISYIVPNAGTPRNPHQNKPNRPFSPYILAAELRILVKIWCPQYCTCLNMTSPSPLKLLLNGLTHTSCAQARPPIPSPAMKMLGMEVRFVFFASSARSSFPWRSFEQDPKRMLGDLSRLSVLVGIQWSLVIIHVCVYFCFFLREFPIINCLHLWFHGFKILQQHSFRMTSWSIWSRSRAVKGTPMSFNSFLALMQKGHLEKENLGVLGVWRGDAQLFMVRW